MMETRKAIMGASVVIIIMIPIAVVGSFLLYSLCSDADCSIGDEGSSSEQQLSQQYHNAVASGLATQILYGVSVGEENQGFTEAVKKFAYCRNGPGEPGEQWCQNTPEESAIRDALDAYDPRTEATDALTGVAYTVEISYAGEQIFQLSSGDMGSKKSTFIYVEPVPGGNHAEIKLVVEKGSLTNGVVT